MEIWCTGIEKLTNMELLSLYRQAIIVFNILQHTANGPLYNQQVPMLLPEGLSIFIKPA
jgi:hypothetical protein